MKNVSPKVSIIIPCWNAKAYIESAISSCPRQSYPNLEIIVINDGSKDGSKEIINGFGDQVVKLQLANGVANKARNIGITKSTGQYIKMLDADDLLEEEFIQKQVDYLKELKEKEIGYGHYKEIDMHGEILEIERARNIEMKTNLKYLIKSNILISLPLYH